MLTFLEFYRALLSFVNYKLYTDINLHYPPRLDSQKDAWDVGLSAIVFEPIQSSLPNIESANSLIPSETEMIAQRKKSEARLKSLSSKIHSFGKRVLPTADLFVETPQLDLAQLNQLGNGDGALSLEEIPTIMGKEEHERNPAMLFHGFVFFLNREVPRESLEFVIRSFGGEVIWDNPGDYGLAMKEDDPRITHQIVDKQVVLKRIKSRDYIQPQYVYDCVNSLKILPTYKYSPDAVLPPHLSPFVEKNDKEYDPLNPFPDENPIEAQTMANDMAMQSSQDDEHDSDLDDNVGIEEAHRRRELRAEIKGQAYDDSLPMKPVDKLAKIRSKQMTEVQEKKLAEIMMGKKDRRLYQRIQYGQRKKDREVSMIPE